MAAKAVRFFLGIFSFPILIGVSYAFIKELSGFGYMDSSLIFLGCGVGAYFVIHLFLYKPQFLYVFGHEVVHMIAAWLCGGRVNSFKASKKGGSVSLSKNNLFIELSPYFVPFYTLLTVFVYKTLKFFGWAGWFSPKILLFLAGMSLAMHIAMTVDALKTEQPDLARAGRFLAVIFICIANMFITILFFSMLFSGISVKGFLINSFLDSRLVYEKLFYYISDKAGFIARLLNR